MICANGCKQYSLSFENSTTDWLKRFLLFFLFLCKNYENSNSGVMIKREKRSSKIIYNNLYLHCVSWLKMTKFNPFCHGCSKEMKTGKLAFGQMDGLRVEQQ